MLMNSDFGVNRNNWLKSELCIRIKIAFYHILQLILYRYIKSAGLPTLLHHVLPIHALKLPGEASSKTLRLMWLRFTKCVQAVSRHICRKWWIYRRHCSVRHRCNLVFKYYCRYYSRERGIYLLFLAANFKKCALALRVCWAFLKNGGSFQSANAMNAKSGKRLDERHLGTRHGFPPPVSESALIFACLCSKWVIQFLLAEGETRRPICSRVLIL